MVGPVVGVGLANAFIGNNYLLFLVPGAFGIVAVVLWTLLISEPDNRATPVGNRLTVAVVLRSLAFRPQQYPDFAWNWLARLLFMTGVTFATTFSTLFYASRLSPSGQVSDVGEIITILALVGVVGTGGGALLGGFVSDKLRRRRIFVLGSGIMFTVGALVLAFGGSSFIVLLLGSLAFQFGLGIFSAVDQAIVLNVLPEIDEEAGRFLGVNGYSTSIAQALAPILAAPLLLVGVAGTEKNYGLLLIIAAVLTLIAGVLVQWKVRGVQ
jgi:MFS family permease